MSRERSDSYKRMYGLGAAFIVGFVLLYFFGQPYPNFMRDVSNVIFPLSTLAITVVAGFSVRRYGWRERFGRVWLMLFLFAFLWFLGDLTWATYVLGLQIDVPYPSLADLFYLGSYIPYTLGLLQYLWIFREAVKKRLIVISLGVSALIFVVSYPYVVHPILMYEEELLIKCLDLLYLSLEFILQVPLFIGLGLFFKGAIGRSWFLFTVAGLVDIAGELAFTYFVWQDLYFEGHPSELLYLLSAVLYVLAFYSHMKEL